ncbi:MAG: metallophosphoesterase [Oscillospiraceae bacterium]|nr:metallophosphoesterase [Oscillospiraceae bacterium]
MVTAPPRRRALRGLILCLAVCAVLAALCGLTILALRDDLGTTEYRLAYDDLPDGLDGFRIALIADLHSEYFGDGQRVLLDAVDEARPDVVVLCGDILDSTSRDFAPIEALLAGLTGRRVFAVNGNHENAVTYAERLRLEALYREYGVTFLKDETVVLDIGVASLTLSGMDDPAVWNGDEVGFLAGHRPDVAPDPDGFSLLLCHRANLFPETGTWGYDLVLSGHIHGGQVRLPLIGGLISPTRRLFPKYDAGVFRENGSVMVVSRGLGNQFDWPRVFNPPELVLVELTGADS